jgi:hypothetical protein
VSFDTRVSGQCLWKTLRSRYLKRCRPHGKSRISMCCDKPDRIAMRWQTDPFFTSFPVPGIDLESIDSGGAPTEKIVPWPSLKILFFHGGGYTKGSPRSCKHLAVNLVTNRSGKVCVPDYRVAPIRTRLSRGDAHRPGSGSFTNRNRAVARRDSSVSPRPATDTCDRCSSSERWRSSALPSGRGTGGPWLVQLMARRTTKVAAVALANKTARIVRALMTGGEHYREPAIT